MSDKTTAHEKLQRARVGLDLPEWLGEALDDVDAEYDALRNELEAVLYLGVDKWLDGEALKLTPAERAEAHGEDTVSVHSEIAQHTGGMILGGETRLLLGAEWDSALSCLAAAERERDDYREQAWEARALYVAAAKERDRLRADHAPHMCRTGHPMIRHWDSEHEECPLCRARTLFARANAAKRAAARERARLLAEVKRLRAHRCIERPRKLRPDGSREDAEEIAQIERRVNDGWTEAEYVDVNGTRDPAAMAHLRALLAEVERLRAASAWCTHEDLPEAGRWVLCVNPGYDPVVLRVTEHIRTRWTLPGFGRGRWRYIDDEPQAGAGGEANG